MQLDAGKVAVVTGASSGIGFALADRFATSGLNVVLADIDGDGLDKVGERIAARGVQTMSVVTDVSDAESVQALADAAVERFGAVHVVCNNAGVVSVADPWFGPLSTWQWVLNVNLWGVVHGVRAFLPTLLAQGEGHIVNTASIAGLLPGFSPSYDASKHAVVAMTEDLYAMLTPLGVGVGVSVLCPGWVRTNIMDADRNWPTILGDKPAASPISDIVGRHVQSAIDEGTTPAAVADLVADAITADRFWIFPNPEFVDLAARRWDTIRDGSNPELSVDMPGLPPAEQIAAEITAALTPNQ
jgi:NAD(P)-dependent dehydrogenase (short-subunit alcohol dehydrogenase family)